jgi:acyl-[acyl carrier protein]--UDP-N-acetylglucosamine O-acyltransferase
MSWRSVSVWLKKVKINCYFNVQPQVTLFGPTEALNQTVFWVYVTSGDNFAVIIFCSIHKDCDKFKYLNERLEVKTEQHNTKVDNLNSKQSLYSTGSCFVVLTLQFMASLNCYVFSPVVSSRHSALQGALNIAVWKEVWVWAAGCNCSMSLSSGL